MLTAPTSTENVSEVQVQQCFMGGQEGVRHARIPHRMPALTIRHATRSVSTSEEDFLTAAAAAAAANPLHESGGAYYEHLVGEGRDWAQPRRKKGKKGKKR